MAHTRFSDTLERGAASATSEKVQSYLTEVTGDTIAALQYTGGTTGVAKGAMLTHTNLVSNTMQMVGMCGDYLRPGKETVMTALPLYHVFAFTVNLLAFFHLGAHKPAHSHAQATEQPQTRF